MKTFVKPGNEINFILADSTTILSGEVVVAGSLVGVSAATYTSGVGTNTVGVMEVTGVHRLPKVTTEAVSLGQKLYYDTTAKRVTTTVGTNAFIGYADAAELAAATHVRVLLARPGS